MTPEELLDVVTLNDDLISKKIPRGQRPKVYTCPDFEIPVKYTRFANGEVKAELMQAVRDLRCSSFTTTNIRCRSPAAANLSSSRSTTT